MYQWAMSSVKSSEPIRASTKGRRKSLLGFLEPAPGGIRPLFTLILSRERSEKPSQPP
jgi:hypothetical protein